MLKNLERKSNVKVFHVISVSLLCVYAYRAGVHARKWQVELGLQFLLKYSANTKTETEGRNPIYHTKYLGSLNLPELKSSS